MKHIILAVMLLASVVCFGQSTYSKVNANTFEKTATVRGSSEYTPTNNYYIVKGVKYQIYTHKCTRGENAGKTFCYIKRTSKSGKEYWQKIDVKPEELSK